MHLAKPKIRQTLLLPPAIPINQIFVFATSINLAEAGILKKFWLQLLLQLS